MRQCTLRILSLRSYCILQNHGLPCNSQYMTIILHHCIRTALGTTGSLIFKVKRTILAPSQQNNRSTAHALHGWGADRAVKSSGQEPNARTSGDTRRRSSGYRQRCRSNRYGAPQSKTPLHQQDNNYHAMLPTPDTACRSMEYLYTAVLHYARGATT